MSKERFRRYILARWGTQAAFAKHIGWSRQRLSKWLANNASPRLSRANNLARAMGITVGELSDLLDDEEAEVKA